MKENNWPIWNSGRGNSLKTEDGIKIVSTNTGQNAILSYLTVTPEIGDVFTLTFKARGTFPALEAFMITTGGNNQRIYYSDNILQENTFSTVTVSFTFNNTNPNPTNRIFLGGRATESGQWIEIAKDSVKLERGVNSNPLWSVAPEDIEEKIIANTTSIGIAQGQINGLISENTITKGDVTTLKDNYTSINATVDGINTTVASHTSSIGNLTTDLSGVSGKIATVENKQT
ncbi:MAG: hypothetical protein KH415_24555, partial [Clostridium sp.]|nr:hypothetical protein [Clostridium sp.]